jgi:hypothetical protein
MVRRLLLVALCGCHGDGGRHYLLQVTPTARAESADTLALTLRRSDDSEMRDYRFGLHAGMSAPWLLDVQTGAWGAAPIEVTVEAQSANSAVARGSGTPAGDTIAVTLMDVGPPGDGSVDDLAPPPDLSSPDLSSLPDLSSPDLTPLPDLSCPVTALLAPLLADASIAGSSPTLNFGIGAVANVGVAVASVGVFRFDVHALPLAAKIRAVRLRLSYAKNSSACNTSCGTCNGIDASGLLALFYLRSDWVENQCTYNMATSTAPWGSPGASLANVDRSAASIATVNHTANQDVAFDVDPSAFAALNTTWRANDQISFAVVPSNGAVEVLATKEWDNCPVAGTVPTAPSLEIDYCP